MTSRIEQEKHSVGDAVIPIKLADLSDTKKVHEVCRDASTKSKENRRLDRNVYLLLDARAFNLTESSKEVRDSVRAMTEEIKADAIAIVGSNRALISASLILPKKSTVPTAFFKLEQKARRWLLSNDKELGSSRLPLVFSALIGAIGILGLLGWQIDNTFLTGSIFGLRPINPVAAIGLLVMAAGFLLYWKKWYTILRIGGVFVIAVGVVSLLSSSTDTLLYGEKVMRFGDRAVLADSAAVSFILLGSLSLVLARPFSRSHVVVRMIGNGVAASVVLISLVNVFGQLYAKDYILGFGTSFAMAFNLALGLALAGIGIILLDLFRSRGDFIARVSTSGWILLAAIVVLQVGGYAIWLSTVNRNEVDAKQLFEVDSSRIQQSIGTSIQAYNDALVGYGGLFLASDTVTENEFSIYNASLDIKRRYPGIRSFAFLAVVKDEDLESFAQNQREIDPDFTYMQLSDKPLHFIALYLPDTPDSSLIGLDLSSVPGRSEIYGSAVNSGTPHTSGSIQYPDGAVGDKSGFFITSPVKNKTSKNFVGLVNANFNYKSFFESIVSKNIANDDMTVTILDPAEDNKLLYESIGSVSSTRLTQTLKVPIGDRIWSLANSGPIDYGLSTAQKNSPAGVIVFSQIATLFFLVIFFLQASSRRHALVIADVATKDLQIEKNNILELHKKDEAILSSIGDGVFAIDTDKRIILFNEAAEELSGFKAEAVLGKPYDHILEFTHEHNGAVNDAFIVDSLAGQKTKMANHTNLKRQDGVLISVADSASPILDASSTVIGSIVVFRDASEERELSRRADVIAEAKGKDDALINAIGEGMIVFDNDGRIIRINKLTTEILGYTSDELVGKTFVETVAAYNFDGEKLRVEDRPATKINNTYRSVNASLEYETKTGERVPVRISIAPITVDANPSGAIALFQDITKERELDRSKDDFIGLVSHQLSTPATAVKANLGMIVEGLAVEPEEIAEAVKDAYESNERQIQIVQDFLNVARLENNRLKPQLEAVNVRNIIEGVLKDQQINLDNRKHRVDVTCDDTAYVTADAHLLSFILNNLVSNASKYSDEGKKIVVEVRESANTYHISVIDEGVGVQAENIERLFQRFSRVQNNLSATVGGTGLGLYIAKKMVGLMNGTLEVRSKINTGSRFIVTLPKGEKNG